MYTVEDFKNDNVVFGIERQNELNNLINTLVHLSDTYNFSNRLNIIIQNLNMKKLNPDLERRYTSTRAYLGDRIVEFNNLITKRENLKNRIINILDGYLLDMENAYAKSAQFNRPEDASMINFPVEKGIKSLYSLCNIDTLILDIENGHSDISALSDDELYDEIGKFWKSIKDGFSTDVINQLQIIGSDLIFSNWNSHSIYPALEKLPLKIKTMVKYYLTTGIAKELNSSLDLNTDNVFNSLDYFLMIRDFNIANASSNDITNAILRSSDFDKGRYNALLNEQNYLFNKSFVYAIYYVFKHELNSLKHKQRINVPAKYLGIKNVYSTELEELLHNEDMYNKVELILNDPSKISAVNTLSTDTFCTFIKHFNINEINWIFDTCANSQDCSIEEMLYYCVFFKQYVNSFSYNNERYKRISKLFNTIKNSNDLSKLGTHIASWYRKIKLDELTEEELDELDKIDPKYIENSLFIRDRILYKKCKERNLKFRTYYSRMISNGKFNSFLKPVEVDLYKNTGIPRLVINNAESNDYFNKYKNDELMFNYQARAIMYFLRVNNIDESKIPPYYYDFDYCLLKEAIETVIADNGDVYKIPLFYLNYLSEPLKLWRNSSVLIKGYQNIIGVGLPREICDRFGITANVIRMLSSHFSDEQILEILSELERLNVPIDIFLKLVLNSISSSVVFCDIKMKITILASYGLIEYDPKLLLFSNNYLEMLLDKLKDNYDLKEMPETLKNSELKNPILIDKILEKNIDLYNLCLEIGDNVYSLETEEEIDRFIKFYEYAYSVKYDAAMVDQDLFEIYKIYKIVLASVNRAVMCDSIFYTTVEEVLRIKDFCKSYSYKFRPELLYFDELFIYEHYDLIVNDIFEFIEYNAGTSNAYSYSDAMKLVNKVNGYVVKDTVGMHRR